MFRKYFLKTTFNELKYTKSRDISHFQDLIMNTTKL